MLVSNKFTIICERYSMHSGGEITATSTTDPLILEDPNPGIDQSAKSTDSGVDPASEQNTIATTPSNTPSAGEAQWSILDFLPGEKIAEICAYLDFYSLFTLLKVNHQFRTIVQQHIFRLDFWRDQLLTDFHIPLTVSKTFLFPHLAHERLSTLARQPYDYKFEYFRKIRYAFCAPGYDPFSMPWLFYPFVGEFYKQFINRLNNDGLVFRAYYVDMACRVGNLAFIKFMVKHYGFKLNSDHLNYACDSGNLELVKYCIEQHNLQPSKKALDCSAISGNLELVQYLIQNFALLPSSHTLNLAMLSGNLENVDFFRNNYQLEYDVNTLDSAIVSGNCELLISLPNELNSHRTDFILPPKTMSLKLVQHLIQHKGFVPTQETLDKALTGVHHDLVELLLTTTFKHIPNFLIDFSHVCISGNIDYVKKIIQDQNQDPDLDWLLCAILSGNVLLVKFLIETYSLDPRKIDFSRVYGGFDNNPFVFCHVPMAKFLIEEHGCEPLKWRFEDYIRGKNLPVAHYLITECGFKCDKSLFVEMNPDDPFAHIWLDGGPFEQLFAMGHQARLKNMCQAIVVEYLYKKELSSNLLFKAFRLKDSFRFYQLHPGCDLSALDENFISAISLFVRERFQHHTYLEIAPPCSHKKQNTRAVLEQVALSIQNKLEKQGKPTKTLFIPFSIDENDRVWHLLELTFDQVTKPCIISAKIHGTKDYLHSNKNDPQRQREHEWTYDNSDDYVKISEADEYETVSDCVLQTYFSDILTYAQDVFGNLSTKTYNQSIISTDPHTSMFSLLLVLLMETNLIGLREAYKNEYHTHRLNYNYGGYFLSTLATSHWRTEVLGFLYVNLSRIPKLIQQGFSTTDNTQNLALTLTSAFLYKGTGKPKLVSADQHKEKNQNIELGWDYSFIKEAFLETYEFDGYNAATQEFTPAFSEDPNRKYKFPAKFLTFWTALAIFCGIPSRPEKFIYKEGVKWTWRQYVRNFFAGWNPIEYNEESDQYNIEGKVLLNLFLIPLKFFIGLYKLLSIPFKTALNIIKLFTEFLPTVIYNKMEEWLHPLYKLWSYKIRHSQGIFVISAYLIFGGLSLFYATLLISLKLWTISLRPATSPEKSVRMAWEFRNAPDSHTVIAVAAIVCSLFGTVVYSTIIVACLWSLALPAIIVQFPAIVALFTAFIHLPIISSAAIVTKGTILSLWALVEPINIPLINFGLIVASTLTAIIASHLSDALSNAWARWVPVKSPIKVEVPTLEKEDKTVANPSNMTIQILTGYKKAEQEALLREKLATNHESRVGQEFTLSRHPAHPSDNMQFQSSSKTPVFETPIPH